MGSKRNIFEIMIPIIWSAAGFEFLLSEQYMISAVFFILGIIFLVKAFKNKK